jgi:hypothetical protein
MAANALNGVLQGHRAKFEGKVHETASGFLNEVTHLIRSSKKKENTSI